MTIVNREIASMTIVNSEIVSMTIVNREIVSMSNVRRKRPFKLQTLFPHFLWFGSFRYLYLQARGIQIVCLPDDKMESADACG